MIVTPASRAICFYLPANENDMNKILQYYFQLNFPIDPQITKTINQAAHILSQICVTHEPTFAISGNIVCQIFHQAMSANLSEFSQEVILKICFLFAKTLSEFGIKRECLNEKNAQDILDYRTRVEQTIYSDLAQRN